MTKCIQFAVITQLTFNGLAHYVKTTSDETIMAELFPVCLSTVELMVTGRVAVCLIEI